jgi:hypothetical protein
MRNFVNSGSYLLTIALAGIYLQGCKDQEYDTFNECVLGESKNIKYKEALSSVRSLCNEKLRSDKESKKKVKLIRNPQWIKTYQDEKRDYVAYVDKNSIEIYRDNIRHVWGKTLQNAKLKPKDYYLFRYEFLCADRKFRINNASEYTNGNFQRNVAVDYNEDIVPGSPVVGSYNYVCGYESS